MSPKASMQESSGLHSSSNPVASALHVCRNRRDDRSRPPSLRSIVLTMQRHLNVDQMPEAYILRFGLGARRGATFRCSHSESTSEHLATRRLVNARDKERCPSCRRRGENITRVRDAVFTEDAIQIHCPVRGRLVNPTASYEYKTIDARESYLHTGRDALQILLTQPTAHPAPRNPLARERTAASV